ncbi:MAG: hypothetical protein RRZ85_08955 [Gordonibacter sp.]|uniref:hypothetical protein n=1 Tax=Gordonibacter sp. TaxID=1968902 RepID=UPI002FC8EAB7
MFAGIFPDTRMVAEDTREQGRRNVIPGEEVENALKQHARALVAVCGEVSVKMAANDRFGKVSSSVREACFFDLVFFREHFPCRCPCLTKAVVARHF